MENQKKANLGRKRLGIASQLQGVMDPQKHIAKTTLTKSVTDYRANAENFMYRSPRATTAVLFADHEIKNKASRAKCAIAGFHRLAVAFFGELRGSAEDVIFSLALDATYDNMRHGDWRAMIDRMKEFVKTDTVDFAAHLTCADPYWETFYATCRDCRAEIAWDQMLWIVANGAQFKPIPGGITHIVVGEVDRKTWTPVQAKLFEKLRAMYPDAVIVDADAS